LACSNSRGARGLEVLHVDADHEVLSECVVVEILHNELRIATANPA
jgi:hypothetical protein